MNNIYAKQRHIYDASRKYYLLGRDQLIEDLMPPAGGHVLEIGCGTGRNLTKAAQKYPNANYYGIDISDEMLKSANQLIAKHALLDKVRLANADATDFDPSALFGVEQFDRIFISYSLSMIPDWQATLREAMRHLTDNGALHMVDFGGQSGLPTGFKWILSKWLALFHVTPRAELENQTRALAKKQKRRLLFERPFRDYAQYAVIGAKD